MHNSALIIGGSLAGLQAAMDLADTGVPVHLIEQAPFIGLNGKATIAPHLLNTRLLELTKHSRATVWTRTRLDGLERRGDAFQVRLRKDPRYVDVARCNDCGDCIEACPVEIPGTDHKAVYRLNDVQPACAVIAKEGRAPCSAACPAGINVQGYVALISAGRYQEAADLIRESMPFPAICGRICTHPCEADCRRTEVDEPVAIRPLKRFLTDWERSHGMKSAPARGPIPLPADNAKKVAVVGSGPAGLTAAWDLVRRGYRATVFEKLSVPGGMMAVGIPAYRLPRDILAAEISAIKKMGVKIRTGVTFGKDISLESLKADGYSAVFLAVGLHGGRRLGVENEDAEGVLQGVEFLRDAALGRDVTIGEEVLVVGGGNVAMDAALTARRKGARHVTMVCLEERAEMPAWKNEIHEALEGNIKIVNSFGPKAFFIDNGNRVAGIEFKACTAVFDPNGRFSPTYDEDECRPFFADTVIIAIGQSARLERIKQQGIGISPQGILVTDPATLQTSVEGVFTGGDSVYGPKSVVEAIAAGKHAAESIHRYLSAHTSASFQPGDENSAGNTSFYKVKTVVEKPALPISNRPLTADELQPKPRVPMPLLPLQKRHDSFDEVELGYTEPQALAEASRCLICGPCSECMACVNVCKPEAIHHHQPATFTELEIGAILYADDPDRFGQLPLTHGKGVRQVVPDDILGGSAAAARILGHMSPVNLPALSDIDRLAENVPLRIGIFICECGQTISGILDVERLRNRVAALPHVAHVRSLPVSCISEAAGTIESTVSAVELNKVILAACSCCNLDQVCYSCTFQRVRCKQYMGVFHSATAPLPDLTTAAIKLPIQAIEYVNIREHCAWAHPDEPRAATDKAATLIAAAAARLRQRCAQTTTPWPAVRSVAVVGNGEAAQTCWDLLRRQRIEAYRLNITPLEIRRTEGCYNLIRNHRKRMAQAVILAPGNPEDALNLLAAFGPEAQRPRIRTIWGGIETHRPGVFYCSPDMDGSAAGAAAALRACAWLRRSSQTVCPTIATVDPHRCRACQTCMEICEFGAPQLTGAYPDRNAWIDPMICSGCGTCAAHCPSGAITAGDDTDAQLAAILDTALTRKAGIHEY
jgi:NADPH-dependent glutamate synthase beta subunit-like oxidoreductase/Pyruvate/2-oxoacid:ferredoxin oxidoreductase delta subunit